MALFLCSFFFTSLLFSTINQSINHSNHMDSSPHPALKEVLVEKDNDFCETTAANDGEDGLRRRGRRIKIIATGAALLAIICIPIIHWRTTLRYSVAMEEVTISYDFDADQESPCGGTTRRSTTLLVPGDDSSWYDGCNVCTGNNCNTRDCVGGCDVNGFYYDKGEKVHSVDCNVCKCFKSGVFCTNRNCRGCYYEGNKYESGATFSDGCNSCTCEDDGEVTCSQDDECDGCTWQGILYEVDTCFVQDGDNVCGCFDEGVACTTDALWDKLAESVY